MLCSSVWFGSFMCFWMDDWMDMEVFDVGGGGFYSIRFGLLYIQLTDCQTVGGGYNCQDL